MSFRFVPKSVTLNGVMAVILCYLSEFGYLPGILRKSSRSLSHLLMSSCKQLGSSLTRRRFHFIPSSSTPAFRPIITAKYSLV